MSESKTVIITGASSGIGKACAKLFLEEGYNVVNASRSNPEPFDSKNYHFIKTDVTKESEIESMVKEAVNKFGKVDVLINNSGFGKFAALVDTTTKDFDEMFSVNVRGLYLCTRYILPYMINEKSGVIINMASIAGKNAIAKGSLYCATKHAVMAISRSLMLEVREHNIRVTAICPGSVDTHFFDEPDTVLNSSRDTILSPEDIAEVCLLTVKLPERALMNEVEIRPANPKKEK